MKQVEVQLKGCPFCSWHPSLDHVSFGGVPKWEIRCPTNHAKTGLCNSLEEAVWLWNTRQPETLCEPQEVFVPEDADVEHDKD